ncbi:MAG: tetraacyldisaccharide 4'-kinase [Armatimonadetes bacterium]|nr:tetraacyldisaccharide 4'-kinase [Armatimonadota bacterium]
MKRTLRSSWIAGAYSSRAPLRSRALIWLLTPLAWLYRAGLAVYLWTDSVGLRKRTHLPVRVISVGNLTLGGTGKTGVVQALASALQKRCATAVLLRGYGAQRTHEALTVSDGQNVLAGWKDSGDEAQLLAQELPGVAVLTGKDRRISGRRAVEDLGVSALVLDDGLQYWQLARDVDVVLVDAQKPFGNGQVMPAGILREPVSGLKRASVLIVTHGRALRESARTDLMRRLRDMAPKAAIHTADYTAVSVDTPAGSSRPADDLRRRRVMAFCGIGSPESFVETLKDAGADVVAQLFLPDHCPISQDDLECAEEWAQAADAEWIMTSAKDFVRMDSLRLPERLRILKAEMLISDFDRLVELACPATSQRQAQL